MNYFSRFLIGVCLIGIAGLVHAGASVSPTETRTATESSEDEAFIGLEWTFGGSVLPEVEVGYRSVDVESNGDVSGAEASLSYNFERGGLGKFKIEAVEGEDNVQGQLGIGYNLANPGFMLTGGAQGNFIFGGIDYTFGSGLDIIGGFNTIGDYDVPAADVTLSCPDGYMLVGTTCTPPI